MAVVVLIFPLSISTSLWVGGLSFFERDELLCDFASLLISHISARFWKTWRRPYFLLVVFSCISDIGDFGLVVLFITTGCPLTHPGRLIGCLCRLLSFQIVVESSGGSVISLRFSYLIATKDFASLSCQA